MKKPIITLVTSPHSGLRAIEAVISSSLNQPYLITLTVLTNTPSNIKDLLFKPIGIQVGKQQYYHGIIHAVSEIHQAKPSQQRLTLRISPALSQLKKDLNFNIFHQQHAVDIIKALLSKYRIPCHFNIQGKFPPLHYTVQYNESTLNFIHRLMDQQGLYYNFQHTPSSHTMIITDRISDSTAVLELPIHHQIHLDEPQLLSLKSTSTISPDTTTTSHYRYTVPMGSPGIQTTKHFTSPIPLSHYHYPSPLNTVPETEHLQQVSNDRYAESPQRFFATSNDMRLKIGSRIRHSTLDTAIVITQLTQRIVDHSELQASHDKGKQSYQNEFSAIHSDGRKISCPHYTTPKIDGVQTAILQSSADNNHTPMANEVKVTFDWAQPASRWLRTSHCLANNHSGHHFLPRNNDEVILTFLHGDPNRPLLVGQLYNTNHRNTFSQHEKFVSGFKSKTLAATGKNGHTLSFDDKLNSEKITMSSSQDTVIHIKRNQHATIKNNQQTQINSGNYQIGVQTGAHVINAKSISLLHGSSSIKIDHSGIHMNADHIHLLASGCHSPKAAARQGDFQQCPRYEDMTIPHTGGKIQSGSGNVLINGKQAAREGDPVGCDVSGTTISDGATSVLVNSKPLAREKDPTHHQGKIMQGSSNVSIGEMINKSS